MERSCERRNDCHKECGTNFREAVCIHTDKVYDSCRDKDCARYIQYVLHIKSPFYRHIKVIVFLFFGASVYNFFYNLFIHSVFFCCR